MTWARKLAEVLAFSEKPRQPEPIRLEIARLDLRPGDILVFKVDEIVTNETIDRIKRMVTNATGLHRVLVLQRGCDLAVLTAAEIERWSAAPKGDEEVAA